ncbi:phospholipase C type enzyme [Curvularia kusanoi]|uniref:Phospholipase C type enzyme n=1 Tax=Curvularia kusanoi TaxID=90978 RepID=A0A9P4TQF2_CURKU|nr:phospholipase C type enzyme [Curvularia kusanoi]
MIPPEKPTSLRVLSLNCWGLKFISTLRNERLTEIGRQIAVAEPRPDIVGLQECWTQEDYTAIRELTNGILPYGKFYHSGCFGGGLAILSRWPIEESNMLRYPLNGRPAAFYRGDWFVGKGVACARIRIGQAPKDVVEVFTTHLHAPYEAEPHDSYICHRTAQAWEIAKTMRAAAERGHLVIGMGDFNMVPLSLAHRIIETHAPVRDVWRIIHPESSHGAAKDKAEMLRGLPMPNAEFNLSTNGTTCDSAFNSWRWNEAHKKRLKKGENVQIDPAVDDPHAKRLDYVFFGSPQYHNTNTGEDVTEWELKEANVGMTMRHPTLHCSLSDHFSVECTLTRRPDSQTAQPSNAASRYLPKETYEEIMATLVKYMDRQRLQHESQHYYFLWVRFFTQKPKPADRSKDLPDCATAADLEMSSSQPQAAGTGQTQQQGQTLLKADDILKLQCLTDDEKQKYRLLMQNTWNMVNSAAAGSPEQAQARQTLQQFSQKFIARERAHRAKVKQQGAQGQSSQPNAGTQQNPVKQEGQANAGEAASNQQSQNLGQQRPQNSSVDPNIIKHVHEFPFTLPPSVQLGTEQADTKLKDFKNGYLNMLAKQASLTENIKRIQAQVQERGKSGQEVPQELMSNKNKVEEEYYRTKAQIEKFRGLQKQWKEERANSGQSAAPTQASQQTPAAQQQPQQQSQQPQQPQRQPSLSGPSGPPAVKEEPQPQIKRPPPAPHSLSMPPHQFPQQGQPQQQLPQQGQARPQINPMQQQHQQSNSPHPQSATGNGPPVPLSHQAAVSAANRSYTDTARANTPMQAGPGGSFHAPGSREREQLNNPKMPIPRHLNVTSPMPVNMGQQRPTMSGPTNGAPGPMGQPVISRPPPFQLEGEGDRVLSKRKLDELVRQVTGGSEEALTPEVEDAVLQLADDFVDNVISNACKLSKLRDSPQLDIRDIQHVLERSYNIRIPGYASDEVRTVRKIVPAAGWVDKMKAVNAAKVMGGKTDF